MDVWVRQANEVLVRWFHGFSASSWRGVEVALLAITLSIILTSRQARLSITRAVAVPFAVAVALVAVRAALDQAWIADDAFISFRYARNFAAGEGLVWNVGHRVEGYTNFLWTLILGVGEWLGLKAPYLSTALTLGTLVALAVVATWKLTRPGWLPLAPMLLVLSPAFIEFGTSGLEQATTAMCIGFVVLALMKRETAHRASWWVLMASLLRPDHALFFAPVGLVQLLAGRKTLKHHLVASLAFGAYWVGRWLYYSDPFPNTFHAKSGLGAYWSQGALYWLEFSLATGLLFFLLSVVLCALLVVWRRRAERLEWSALWVATSGAVMMASYTARVGGDFMEFRFGLTTLVLCALGGDLLLSRLAEGRPWAVLVAGLAIAPLGLTPTLIRPGEKLWHIARESTFYRVKSWAPLEISNVHFTIAQAVAKLPDAGAKAPPLAAGCIGMVGYFSKAPIIDRYGLTEPVIARKEVKERGRPGHEKYATREELMRLGAQWGIDPEWPEPIAARAAFDLNGWKFCMLRDTPELRAIASLPSSETLTAATSREDALLQLDIVQRIYADGAVTQQYVDAWELFDPRTLRVEGQSVQSTVEGITAMGPIRVHGDLACDDGKELTWSVRGGLCDLNSAPCSAGRLAFVTKCAGENLELRNFSLQQRDLAKRLQTAGTSPARLAHVVSSAPNVEARRWSFDHSDEMSSEGAQLPREMFAVTASETPAQAKVYGIEGAGFLNGYINGDAPTGTAQLTVPVQANQPYLVAFKLAGGSACESLHADVTDSANRLDRACGRQDERLRTFAAIVTPRTEVLQLQITDSHSGPWGHLSLDAVVVAPVPIRARE